MAHYKQSTIRRIVEQLSGVYGIPGAEFKVVFGAAMVMHGLRSSVEDIELVVPDLVFSDLLAYLYTENDQWGAVIKLPGDITIRPISTLRTIHVFEKVHGCQVASLVSLREIYMYLTSEPAANRSKVVDYAEWAHALGIAIERRSNVRVTELNQSGRLVAEEVQMAVLSIASTKIFDKLDAVLELERKDSFNCKWRFKFDPVERSIAMYEVGEVHNGQALQHKLVYSQEVIDV